MDYTKLPDQPLKTPLGSILEAVGYPKQRLSEILSNPYGGLLQGIDAGLYSPKPREEIESQNKIVGLLGSLLAGSVPYDTTIQDSILAMLPFYRIEQRAFQDAPFQGLFNALQGPLKETRLIRQLRKKPPPAPFTFQSDPMHGLKQRRFMYPDEQLEPEHLRTLQLYMEQNPGLIRFLEVPETTEMYKRTRYSDPHQVVFTKDDLTKFGREVPTKEVGEIAKKKELAMRSPTSTITQEQYESELKKLVTERARMESDLNAFSKRTIFSDLYDKLSSSKKEAVVDKILAGEKQVEAIDAKIAELTKRYRE